MTTFTIKSRNHGQVTFFCMNSDRPQYVKFSKGNHADSTSPQICDGGGFRGNTLTATADTLERTARKWWKQHLKMERTY